MGISKIRKAVRIISFVLIVYGGLFAYFLGVKIFPLIPISLPISYSAGEISLLGKSYGIHFFEDWIMDLSPFTLILPILITFLICWLLFASFLCGWLCPLGCFQDFLSFIRKKLKIEKLILPKKIEKFFDYFRYIFLFLILIITFLISDYFVNQVGISAIRDMHGKVSVSKTSCAGTVLDALRGEIEKAIKRLTPPSQPIRLIFYFIGLLFLGFYFGSFFIERFYCRVCPIGAVNFLFNEGSFLFLEKDNQRCTRCGICLEVCPMNQRKVYEERIRNKVDSMRCIKCFKCVEKCPEDNCLKVRFMKFTIFSSKFKNIG